MSFRPSITTTISISDCKYYFCEHPFAKGMPYGQTGRRATVYQVQDSDGRLQAFKVFAKAYRTELNFQSAQRIRAFSELPGLKVCSRNVLTPELHDALLNQYPDLEYSVLMPWINGETWQEIITSSQPLNAIQVHSVASWFTFILKNMEKQQIAHCDLSGGNVLLPALWAQGPEPVALVDVEDIYAPGLSRPESPPGGSVGYAHKTSSTGLWEANADRFAGAVLIAEMLGWYDPGVRRNKVGEQYFSDADMQTDCKRYRILSKTLDSVGQTVSNLFNCAWFSNQISDCPSFEEWHQALAEIQPSMLSLQAHQDVDTSPIRISRTLPTFKPDYIPIQPPVDTNYRIPGPPTAGASPKAPIKSKPTRSRSWQWWAIFLFGISLIATGLSAIAGIRLSVWQNNQQNTVQKNTYIVNLNDFFTGRTLPVSNLNGSQIGQIDLGYGWYLGDGNEAKSPDTLATVRIFLNLTSGESAYRGFATVSDPQYDPEEREIPKIGNSYTTDTGNYLFLVKVIDYSVANDWDSEIAPFERLTLEISVQNK